MGQAPSDRGFTGKSRGSNHETLSMAGSPLLGCRFAGRAHRHSAGGAGSFDSRIHRQLLTSATVVKTSERALYYVLGNGQAVRYGSGSAGLASSGPARP